MYTNNQASVKTDLYQKVTDMIMEWRKGCSCSNDQPISCNECTLALIKAIDIQAFTDETIATCEKIIKEHSGFVGVSMAMAHMATAMAMKNIQLRAINEHNNTKD